MHPPGVIDLAYPMPLQTRKNSIRQKKEVFFRKASLLFRATRG
jgi:hypothetical protein